MSPEMVATLNKAANMGPRLWGAGSQYENEQGSPEHHLRPLFYRVDGIPGNQPTQAYLADAPAERAHSTVEDHISIGHRFTDCILGCTLPDSANPLLEASNTTVQFSPARLENLLILSGSRRNFVTILTSDGVELVVTCRMADVDPSYWPREPEGYLEAPLHPAAKFFTKGFAGVRLSDSTTYSVLSDPADSPSEAGATALSSQFEADKLSTIMGSLRDDLMQMPGGSALVITRKMADVAPAYLPSEPEVHIEAPLHPIVQSFAKGFAGVRPSVSTLEIASRIVEAAIEKTVEREIEVDNTDGVLSFELRLTNGLLVIGELSLDGHLHANVYNDRHPNVCAGVEEIWVEHLPQTSATDLIALF